MGLSARSPESLVVPTMSLTVAASLSIDKVVLPDVSVELQTSASPCPQSETQLEEAPRLTVDHITTIGSKGKTPILYVCVCVHVQCMNNVCSCKTTMYVYMYNYNICTSATTMYVECMYIYSHNVCTTTMYTHVQLQYFTCITATYVETLR